MIKTANFEIVEEPQVIIPIKYNDTYIKMPRLNKIKKGDWIDLYASHDQLIRKGECKLINLGITMQLPDGYEAHILPRSSTFKKWGIIMTNSQGIVDETYCGDNDWWLFSAYCLEPKQDGVIINITDDSKLFKFMIQHRFTSFIMHTFFKKTIEKHKGTLIKAGDKIAQFRIVEHMPTIKFEEKENLGNKDRGGFGTTGSK